MGALVGYGGHGRDIERIWMAVHPHRKLALYDDAWGPDDDCGDLRPPGDLTEFYLGVNDPHVRHDMARRWATTTAFPLVHPKATVTGASALGPGVVIAAGVFMGLFSHLGEHTHVNFNVGMTRATVGNFCTLGPGVTIGGDVTIGDRVNVCMGALIGVRHPGETVTIGDDATIGAGAVVLHDIPAGETWVGNPARRLR